MALSHRARFSPGMLALATAFWMTIPASAQWVTQQIKLAPGFNAVYLQVTPPNPDCAAVFGDVPGLRDVWMYNRYLQTSTFITNPQEAAPLQDHWLMWFPSTSEKSFLSTLARVRGGQCYLIHLAPDAAPVTLNIVGIPAPPRIDWIPKDLTLAGFPISETARVTFYQFLKDTPEVSTIPGTTSGIYSINPLSARETQIRNPELTAITPGKAYWVRLNVFSHNPYPCQVLAPGENNSIQFIQDQKVATLTLVNSVDTGSTTPQTLRLRLIDSEPAPAGRPERAGRAEVAALIAGPDGSLSPKLLADGLDITLASGETRELPIALATGLLAPSTSTNATYQALIEVTEVTHGYRQLVPVVAEVPGSSLFARRGSLMSATAKARLASPPTGVTADSPSAGLWLGTVTLTGVNNPGFSQSSNPDAADYPVSPATPIGLRALVHVNADGVGSLVQQVYFADVPDGTNRAIWMYNSPNSFPAGAVPKARISAPSWPRLPPARMTGNFGGNLNATLTVPYDDPVNPFVHRYHPDHNNLAEDFETKLPAGQESFDIVRNASFYFGSTIVSGSAYGPAVPVLKFTGAAGEYVNTSAFANTPGFTVQFWANIPKYEQNGATILLLTNAATRAAFQIAFQNNTGLLTVTLQNEEGVAGQVVAASPVPLGRWFNVTATYDGFSGKIYFDGAKAGNETLPELQSGSWTSAWIGNTDLAGTPSFVGEIHDLVVRNNVTSSSSIADVMVVPDVIDPTGIILRVQGDPNALTVVNVAATPISMNSSGGGLIDASAAPSVPLWTYGTAQGTYRETISGLRRQAITVSGTFQFTRINQDPNLR